MADRFSAQWWNDQAKAAGGLDKAAVESLTGMSFAVVWNPDGTIPYDKAWPKQAFLRAPGLGESGLQLSPSPMPASYPYQSAEQAFAARDPNWGGWARIVSPVGYVAPGATTAYNPTLSPVFAPTSAEPPATPIGSGSSAPSAPPDELVTLRPLVQASSPSVAATETIPVLDPSGTVAAAQTVPGAPMTSGGAAVSAGMSAGLMWLVGLVVAAALWARHRER